MADAASAAKVKGAKDRKAKKNDERRRVLRSAAPTAIPAAMRSAVPPGDGQPLPPWLADSMASRFGHDFSSVRIHSSPTSAAYADAFDANAYTLGQHIVFNVRNFSPGTGDGQRLIAHELAHVVQQQRGGSRPELSADASHERAADRAADGIAMGASQIAVVGSTGVGIARDEKDKKNAANPPPKQLTAGSQEPKQLPPGPVTVDQVMADPDSSKRVHQVAAGTAGSVKDITNTQGAIFEEMMNMEVNRRIKYGSGVQGMLPKDVDATKIRFVDPATDPNKLAPGEAMFVTGDRIHGMVDGKKVKLSDGMILLREKEGIRVVTAFEGKSGQRRASDLHRTEAGKEALKPDDKKELGQVKQETNKGKVIESEMGGQVRKTVERLSPHVDDDTTDILVDGKRVSVRASPKTTRYLGVVPKDVDIKASEKQLTEKEGINFRTMKLESSEGDIKVAASKVVEKAQAGKPWPMPAGSKKSDDSSSDSGAAKKPPKAEKSAAIKPPAAKKSAEAKKSDQAKKTAGTKKTTAAQKPAAPKKQAANQSTAPAETKKPATKPPASVPGAADKKPAQPAKPKTAAPAKPPGTKVPTPQMGKVPDMDPESNAVAKPNAVVKAPANPAALQPSAAKPPSKLTPPKPPVAPKLQPPKPNAAAMRAPRLSGLKSYGRGVAGAGATAAVGFLAEVIVAKIRQEEMEKLVNETIPPLVEAGMAKLSDELYRKQIGKPGETLYWNVTIEISTISDMRGASNLSPKVMAVNLSWENKNSSKDSVEAGLGYAFQNTTVTYSFPTEEVPFDDLVQYAASQNMPMDALRAYAKKQISEIETPDPNTTVDPEQVQILRTRWTNKLASLEEYDLGVKQRKSEQARKQKAADDKLDREKLDRMLAADKEKASQKPPTNIPGLMSPGQPSVSSVPLKIGPFDASPEVTPGQRGELIASKYEQEKEKWVKDAEKMKLDYHNGNVSNERFAQFRSRRDEWVAGLNRYAEAMKNVPEMKNGAGRMKALQDWLANDGHNAIMNF